MDILHLPNDVLTLIFLLLNWRETRNLAKICKKWHEVLNSDTIWKQHYERTWVKLLGQNPLQTQPDSTDFLDILPDQTTWKNVFLNKHLSESRWGKGPFQLQRMQGHTRVITAVKLFDGLIFSTDSGGYLKIWKTNGECSFSQRVMTEPIGHLALNFENEQLKESGRFSSITDFAPDHKLVLSSGGVWNTLSAFDLSSMKTAFTIANTQAAGVSVVRMQDNLIVSAGFGYLQVWDIRIGNHPVSAIKTPNSITSVYFRKLEDGDFYKLFTGASDGRVTEWDLKTLTAKKIVKVHNSSVTAISTDLDMPDNLVTKARGLKVWNWEKEEMIRRVKGNREWFHAYRFSLGHNRIISAYRTIQIWDVDKRKMVQEMKLKKVFASASGLDFSYRKNLIVASFSKDIFAWKFDKKNYSEEYPTLQFL